jgi:hypothetical protein
MLLISLPIQAMAYTFTWTDDFSNGINPTYWTTFTDGVSTVASGTVLYSGQVVMTQGSDPTNAGNGLMTTFSITGPFLISVQYTLVNWPYDNYERVGLMFNSAAAVTTNTYNGGTVERISDDHFIGTPPYEGYLIDTTAAGGSINSRGIYRWLTVSKCV